jgi:hypothetical protein
MIVKTERSHRRGAVTRRHALQVLAAAAAIAVAARPFGGAAYANSVHPGKGLPNMTHDLAKLAAEHFEPLIGETFTVGQYRLPLKSVRRIGKAAARFREQFALGFAAPRDSAIRSELMPVSHPAIGQFDLLVTQVMDEKDGTALEICFS